LRMKVSLGGKFLKQVSFSFFFFSSGRATTLGLSALPSNLSPAVALGVKSMSIALKTNFRGL
jgi:hypothetical protein